MNFGFFRDPDATRYCYLRLRRLKEAIKDQKIVAALAEELGLAGGDRKQAMAAIERRIDELRETKSSLWNEVPAPEVLAASIFGARKRAPGEIDRLFCRAADTQALAGPLVSWLQLAGLVPSAGTAAAPGRMSLTAHRGGGYIAKMRLVGVEAVNDPQELDAALEQLEAVQGSAHAVYLACTPALAADYLWAHAATAGVRWDPDLIRRNLHELGIGLLVVEGDAVAQVMLPTEGKPTAAALAELSAATQPKRRRKRRY